MNKTRTTAFLLVLIFLVVAAVTFIFLSSLDKGDTPDNIVIVTPSAEPAAADNSSATAPTTPPDNAATVTLAPAVSEPAPAATPAVVEPTPVPSSNTEPTPAPSATPVPAETYGKPLGSGSFTSDTGAKINIVADWVAMTSGKDTVDVKVTVSVYVPTLRPGLGVIPQFVPPAVGSLSSSGPHVPENLTSDRQRTVPTTLPLSFRRTVPAQSLGYVVPVARHPS